MAGLIKTSSHVKKPLRTRQSSPHPTWKRYVCDLVLICILAMTPGVVSSPASAQEDGENTNYAQPQRPSANLAKAMQSCKKSDKSVYTIRYCTQVLRHPDTSDDQRVFALRKRAKSWAIEDELRAGIRDYLAISVLLPENTEAIFERAKLYDKLAEYNSAKQEYTRLIELDGKNVTAYCKRGLTKINLKDHTSAIEDFTAGLTIDPNRLDCVVGRGDAYQGIGDDDKALQAYTAAIAANERYWDAYFHRAELHKKRGEKHLAIADYSTVLQLDFLNLTAAKALRALGVLSPFPFTN